MLKRLLALGLAVLLLLAPAVGSAQAANVDYTWHADWMQQVGLLRGNGEGLDFDGTVTKAELAAFLQRALDWAAPAQPVAIADMSTSHWAYGAIQAAIANGALELDHGQAHPSAKLSSLDAFAMAKRAGITLELGQSGGLSRGQLLDALGEALTTTITVVHTNDSHGRILADDSNGVLGWERVATIIEQTRAANPNTLVLDAGDAFHGTNEAQFFSGASILNAMNSAGVDVMVPGNHDFNYGQERLLELEQSAAFDIVSANVVNGDTTLLAPYTIRELGGLTVAIFGLTAPETPVLTHPKNVVGLAFQDPIATAQAMVAELKDKADFIIALTHLGYDVDKELALAVPEIGLIIGGHSHTVVTTAEKVNETYIAQAGEHTKYVGQENLIFYQGRLVDLISTPGAFDATIAKSTRTGKLAQEVSAQVQREMSSVIGSAAVLLDGERANVRAKETNLGNLIADVMRQSTGADVAVTNGGGIRATIKVGDITVNDVHTVLPFGNTLCTVKLTGAQIKSVLEHSVRLYPETNGGFLQVSGLTFSFDPSKPAGDRVTEIKVNGKAIDPNATYTVATNDFTAVGGDGFTAFAEGTNLVNTGISLDIVLMEYIQQHGTVSAQLEGRITVIGK